MSYIAVELWYLHMIQEAEKNSGLLAEIHNGGDLKQLLLEHSFTGKSQLPQIRQASEKKLL